MQQGNKWQKLLTFVIFPINIDIYVIIQGEESSQWMRLTIIRRTNNGRNARMA
jgi:hypothetical protein